MKLAEVSFEDAMELEGSIAFPEGKTVVIYGENKAGKSNIIHALRYAFLSKVVRPRKNPGYDELRLVTAKEIAPAEGAGKILIEFEHNGEQFEIRREIDRYKDNNKILRKEAAGGFRELDFYKTVGKELKAGLLDALFAPDSAMGFKHLNEKNIDAVIRELFKEIGNAKVLAIDFKQRVARLKEETEIRVTDIERDYISFVDDLKEKLRGVSIDLGSFETHEPGKTAEKIACVAEGLKKYIDSIEKGRLDEWLKEMRNRAKIAEDIEAVLKRDKEVRSYFGSMEEISKDKEGLSLLLAELGGVKLDSPTPQGPGKFYDDELNKRAGILYQKLEQAQIRYSNALSLAQEEKIDFKIDNPARIRNDKEKVLRLLTREVAISDAPRVKVDLVKICSERGEESVHGLIPLKLMDEDPAFTKLSPEPIPDAPEEHKRQYAEILGQRIGKLKALCEDKDRAESFFNNEFTPLLTDLTRYSTILMEKEKEEREKISKQAEYIHNRLSLFAQEDIAMPKLDHEVDLEPFLLAVRQILSRKKSAYKEEVNENEEVKSVGIQAEEFNTYGMDSLLWKLAEMEKGIPVYRGIWAELTRQKGNEWQNNDAEYADLTYVPAVVDGLDKTLDTILGNAFDEHEVIQGIQEIIVEINSKLTDEGLLNSCIEMGEGSLQLSKTTYKSREITHPCGAERAFFSLATLTALARYFRLPVIIDEAANNLDKNHLRHFISLIREFAASYEVQYILSIKETDDFPLGGWVQEFADDLQIYRVDYDGHKKHIKPVDLYV